VRAFSRIAVRKRKKQLDLSALAADITCTGGDVAAHNRRDDMLKHFVFAAICVTTVLTWLVLLACAAIIAADALRYAYTWVFG
jgi:hypothetical protein